MSKLNIDQKTIQELFTDKKADFLIPDYQRPYAWQEAECMTLWDDIFAFAFPEDDCSKFDSNNDEYFLGPRFTENNLKTALYNFGFFNGRPITKSMLAWWAFSNSSQELLSLETILEIEHIYAKKRNEIEHSLNNSKNIDALGNKALLEKTVNIRAADYRFADKIKYYKGYVNDKGQTKEGTKIFELASFVNSRIDFSEADIEKRNNLIIDSFISFVRSNNLIENS